MFQEAFGQCRTATDASGATADGSLDLAEVLGGEVGQFVGVEVGPAVFERVEFGRVGRQEFGVEPVALGLEPGLGLAALVRREAVPQEHHRAAHMATQRAQKGHRAFRIDAAGLDRQKQTHPPSVGRKRQRPGGGQALPVEAVFEDRGFPPRGPGASDTGLLGVAAFVDDDEAGPQPPLFFLMRGKSWRSHCLTTAGLRSRAWRVGLCAVKPRPRRILQTWPEL